MKVNINLFHTEAQSARRLKSNQFSSAKSVHLRAIVFTLLFFSVSVSPSCSGKKNMEKVPVEFIQPDSMVLVLADIHIAESKILTTGNPDSTAKANLASYYKFVFDKYKVDNIRFKKSFDYYSNHVSLMNDVYDKVIDELSKRQAEIEK